MYKDGLVVGIRRRRVGVGGDANGGRMRRRDEAVFEGDGEAVQGPDGL